MILRNYIFKQVSISTFNVTIIIFSVIGLIQSLRQMDLVVQNGASIFDFIYISVLPTPLWLMMILPMSSLIAVIIVFNRFYNDKETLMFQLSGGSIFLIIKPVIYICLINMIFLSLLNLYIIPKAYGLFKTKQFELRNSISQIFLREGVFNDLEEGLTILIKNRVSKYDLEGIFIYDTRDKNKEIDIFAKKGKIILANSRPIFELIEGNRREVQLNGKVLNEMSFKIYSIDISKKQPDPKFGWYDTNAENVLSLVKENNLVAKAEGHFRLSYPIMTITLPLLAVIMFLCFPKAINKQIYIITSSLLIALLLVLLQISMRRILIVNPSFWFVFYLIPILPIILSIILVYIQNRIPIRENV